MSTSKKTAPSVDRNKEPILAVLRRVLPETGQVLEIASGTGQHVAYFASALTRLEWQPSDPDPDMRASIEAWVAEQGLTNLRSPVALDARDADWPVRRVDAVLCINMVHISPWPATLGLMAGAARKLTDRGVLVLYGPYRRSGHMTPSNEAFDAQLRESNKDWGIRDLETVVDAADQNGLALREVIEMPANNLCVVFRRKRDPAPASSPELG